MNPVTFIREKVEECGSQSEVARKTGLSVPLVHKMMHSDVDSTIESIRKIASGYNLPLSFFFDDWAPEKLIIDDGDSLGLSLVNPSTRMIPVISCVNGGGDSALHWEDAYPVGQGMEQIECPVYLDRDLKAYALKVRGNSMSPRYDEGMTVFVSPSSEISNGDYVVAKLKDGKTILKQVRFSGNLVILQSVNTVVEPDPIIRPREDFEFLSKVVGSKEK